MTRRSTVLHPQTRAPRHPSASVVRAPQRGGARRAVRWMPTPAPGLARHRRRRDRASPRPPLRTCGSRPSAQPGDPWRQAQAPRTESAKHGPRPSQGPRSRRVRCALHRAVHEANRHQDERPQQEWRHRMTQAPPREGLAAAARSVPMSTRCPVRGLSAGSTARAPRPLVRRH